MDAIYAAEHIFDFTIHSYQLQLIAIVKDLRLFFLKHLTNSIKFWDCLSNDNWLHHCLVNKDMKKFKLSFYFLTKSHGISIKRGMRQHYQRLANNIPSVRYKSTHFLDLLDNELHTIELLYIKEGLWIKQFGYSNLLCTKATRAITNHALIKYHLRFFLRENFSCPYGVCPIERRCHILHECRRYNKYWNLLRFMLSHLLVFLKFNLNAFSFFNSFISLSFS